MRRCASRRNNILGFCKSQLHESILSRTLACATPFACRLRKLLEAGFGVGDALLSETVSLSFRASRSSRQVHVLIMEYPGHGICPGRPSGELLMGVAVHGTRIVLRSQESFRKASQTGRSFVTKATRWETGASCGSRSCALSCAWHVIRCCAYPLWTSSSWVGVRVLQLRCRQLASQKTQAK